MKTRTLIAAGLLAVAFAAPAQDAMLAPLEQRLVVLDADPGTAGLAAYERLQARQAIEALRNARSRERDAALQVAQRRVEIAEIAARTAAMQREIERLDDERQELLVEASRQEAARARAETERLRIQAQIQAEEAQRLREQAAAEAQAKQEVEAVLEGVSDAQAARASAAREKEAALAREEAELLAGAKLPPLRREARGEVYTLAGDAFASGQATLTAGARDSLKALAGYLKSGAAAQVRIEGHTDSQGADDANRKLSQRRADAVRDALAAAGVPRSRITATGLGASRPVADNGSAAGRARNRRVEVIVLQKP